MKRRNNENRQRKEAKIGRDGHVLKVDVLKRNEGNNRRMKRRILKVASMSKEVLKNVKIDFKYDDVFVVKVFEIKKIIPYIPYKSNKKDSLPNGNIKTILSGSKPNSTHLKRTPLPPLLRKMRLSIHKRIPLNPN